MSRHGRRAVAKSCHIFSYTGRGWAHRDHSRTSSGFRALRGLGPRSCHGDRWPGTVGKPRRAVAASTCRPWPAAGRPGDTGPRIARHKQICFVVPVWLARDLGGRAHPWACVRVRRAREIDLSAPLYSRRPRWAQASERVGCAVGSRLRSGTTSSPYGARYARGVSRRHRQLAQLGWVGTRATLVRSSQVLAKPFAPFEPLLGAISRSGPRF